MIALAAVSPRFGELRRRLAERPRGPLQLTVVELPPLLRERVELAQQLRRAPHGFGAAYQGQAVAPHMKLELELAPQKLEVAATGAGELRHHVIVVELEDFADRLHQYSAMSRRELLPADLHHDPAAARPVVEVEQHHLLPGAEQQATISHGDRQRWP